jgi:hypothetical protein
MTAAELATACPLVAKPVVAVNTQVATAEVSNTIGTRRHILVPPSAHSMFEAAK